MPFDGTSYLRQEACIAPHYLLGMVAILCTMGLSTGRGDAPIICLSGKESVITGTGTIFLVHLSWRKRLVFLRLTFLLRTEAIGTLPRMEAGGRMAIGIVSVRETPTESASGRGSEI